MLLRLESNQSGLYTFGVVWVVCLWAGAELTKGSKSMSLWVLL